MNNLYGRLSEEERRRLAMGQPLTTPFDTTAGASPMGRPSPMPTRATPMPPDYAAEALAVPTNLPVEDSLAVPDPRDPRALREPPPREGSTTGEDIAMVLSGLGDIAMVPARLKGFHQGPQFSSEMAQRVAQSIRERQSRADNVWARQNQQGMSDRRLQIGEAQEARAAQSYDEARDPTSAPNRALQERARQMREQGILNASDEQIARITKGTWETGDWLGEARANRGVQLNNQMADAAVDRRFAADAIDAGQQVEALREIGYNFPNTPSPEAVNKIWGKAMADERYAAQLQNAIQRKRAGNGGGGSMQRPFMSTSELIRSPDHVQTEYVDELEKDLSQANDAQDRMVLQFQLKQAQDVKNRRIDGLQFIGDVVPNEKQYMQAVDLNKSMNDFTAKTNDGLRKIDELKAAAGSMELGDSYRLMEELHTIQEQREAIGRKIYGFGAPQAHETLPIKRSVGDLTSWLGMATGSAKQVAETNIKRTQETAYGHLRSLQYVPGTSTPGGGGGAPQPGGVAGGGGGALSPAEQAELEELERLYGGGVR